MRSLLSMTVALAMVLGVAMQPALAAHTTRTEMAPVAANQPEPQVAWGFGFYTCVNVMYSYGRRTHPGVSDNILFQGAVDVCSGPYAN